MLFSKRGDGRHDRQAGRQAGRRHRCQQLFVLVFVFVPLSDASPAPARCQPGAYSQSSQTPRGAGGHLYTCTPVHLTSRIVGAAAQQWPDSDCTLASPASPWPSLTSHPNQTRNQGLKDYILVAQSTVGRRMGDSFLPISLETTSQKRGKPKNVFSWCHGLSCTPISLGFQFYCFVSPHSLCSARPATPRHATLRHATPCNVRKGSAQ